MKILIVGGVAGGATAAARLRRLSEDNEIIMFYSQCRTDTEHLYGDRVIQTQRS